MRIALVSTGLGRVRRGFESFTDSLFLALRHRYSDLELTLFQGAGQSGECRVVVPNLHRADYPARWFKELQALYCETRSFALALYPVLRSGHYDIVHYNELTMGSALFHLRRVFGGRFKLLYCNGAPSPPIHYHHRCDFAQVLTTPQYEEALAFGIEGDRLFPVPYGIDAELFHPVRKKSRIATRRALEVPDDAKVILSVAAIKREHKRIDHLLREASALPNVWVVVAGHRTEDTAYLESLAETLVPGRWRFVTWPHNEIADLFGAADVFVLCSLTEAFGLVTVEAMMSEVPVIIHNGPVFSWLAEGTSGRLIDMSGNGVLASAISQSLSHSCSYESANALRRSRKVAHHRFSWEALVPHYLDMYKRTIRTRETTRDQPQNDMIAST